MGEVQHVLLFVVLLLLLTASGSEKFEEKLIGWQGETYKPHLATGLEENVQKNPLKSMKKNDTAWIQTISWSPRAFVYHNFLSRDEVRHIVKLAAVQMKRSTVVGPNNTGVVDNIRTSAGTFLMRNQDSVISAVEERLAVWSQLPPSHQEDMQVLRYGPTNKYGPHMDGLGRVMSVLIYLIAPEAGGETAFPNSNGWLHPEMGEPTQGPFSACAKDHVAYRPKAGDALMFYDLSPDYKTPDGMSTHTGCPVVTGVKWNAVKWIHGIPFRGDEYLKSLREKHVPLPDPGMCANMHTMCEEWAAKGECKKNPGYMLGSSSGQGVCRKACNECTPCQEDDKACIAQNRIKGGYLSFDDAEFVSLQE